MIYLITGATGDVGSKVVECLIKSGERPRVFVRDANKARSLYGDRVDVFIGDLADGSSLRTALEGVDSFFLVNSGPQIPLRDEVAAIAAKDAGVKHLVKLSSMDVQQGLAIGAWHERGEAAIRSSGVPFTFIQPTGFMSNLLAWKNVDQGRRNCSLFNRGGQESIHPLRRYRGRGDKDTYRTRTLWDSRCQLPARKH